MEGYLLLICLILVCLVIVFVLHAWRVEDRLEGIINILKRLDAKK